MRINPHQVLDNGTQVKVGSLLGTVIKHEVVPAVPCGMITVHTIKFTHRCKFNAGRMTTIALAKPKTDSVNYSFIEVLS